ncbi:MAG: sulfatase-like hydrolase/transferase [Bryocella sp.]
MTNHRISRRNFLGNASLSGLALGSGMAGGTLATASAETSSMPQTPARRPNILLYCCDQMRSDFTGGFGENSMTRTPTLDGMVRRGSSFRYAVTNQPLCSPSRACMITGRYATEAGLWKIGQGMRTDLPTLASVLTGEGYSSNFIGKWHLMASDRKKGIGMGWVPPSQRYGFDGLWEGSNEFEWTTHPYEGTIWNNAGAPVNYKDEYRIDFITDRAVNFLRQPHDKPFLLYVSQLEPHQQNDLNRMVAPKGYAERFANPVVPADCRDLPGNWQEQLPDYYGCIQKIDESVGTILKTLEEQGLADDTIVCFISDHGCHFETRNTEYKRSPHDASIRFPFILNGPGFNQGTVRDELVSMIDLTPTLLAAVEAPIPPSMKGRNALPLLHSELDREGWEDVAYIQISESMVGRAIRTREWCYCVVDRSKIGTDVPSSNRYEEYQMYNLFDDPNQQVNLVGRKEYRDKSAMLRDLLLKKMVEAGEAVAEIVPAHLYA